MGPVGNFFLGSPGNLSGIGSDKGLFFAPKFEFFGGSRTQTNRTSFRSGASDHVIEDELDIYTAGFLVHMILGMPIAPGLQLKGGPMFGAAYNDGTLRANQNQAGSLGEARASKSNVSFTTGMSAALSYRLSFGILSFVTAFQNEFDRQVAELTRSNTDPTRVRDGRQFFIPGRRKHGHTVFGQTTENQHCPDRLTTIRPAGIPL